MKNYMKNRIVTGKFGDEPISRPKTLGERHLELFKKNGEHPKHTALKKLGPFSSKGSFTKQLYGHEKNKETVEDYNKSVEANKARHVALKGHQK